MKRRPKRPAHRRSKLPREGDEPRKKGVLSRAAVTILPLAAVLALQLWACGNRLDLPFLDTRLHYDYDTAFFSSTARSGNRNRDLRSQFGVTLNSYSRWEERRGPPSYYTDHPFLVQALFQQYTRLVGTRERASRTFSLAVSFAIAAGAYAVFLQATGSLLAALAGATTLVSLPLFAVYQPCMKVDTGGMLAGVWLFAALQAFFRKETRGSLVLYGALAGLAILAHWTAALFVGAIGVFLLVASWRGKSPAARRALRVTIWFGLAGAGVLVAGMCYLRGSWASARAALARSFVQRSAPIASQAWWARQWTYARANFGPAFAWIALGLCLVLAVRWLWSRRSGKPTPDSPPAFPRPLTTFFFATLFVACVWLFAFREGSFVHVFWQYWFCLPIATLVAAFLASLRPSRAGFAIGIAVVAGLLISFSSAAKAAYADVVRDQFGTPSDIAFLSSLRGDRFDRFVFVPISDTALNDWFQGPLFEYYTDRPVVTADPAKGLRAGDKALVLRYRDRGEVVAGVEEWSHKRLANEKCGERICAYDVAER